MVDEIIYYFSKGEVLNIIRKLKSYMKFRKYI